MKILSDVPRCIDCEILLDKVNERGCKGYLEGAKVIEINGNNYLEIMSRCLECHLKHEGI